MKTPKDKANELIETFSLFQYTKGRNVTLSEKKVKALELCNEISSSPIHQNEYSEIFWQEVKNELEKM